MLQVVLRIESEAGEETAPAAPMQLLKWIAAGQSLRVGRTDAAELVVTHDPQMSSLHFEVRCDGHRARIRDLDSRNGTYLNGQRVGEAGLRHGDLVQAGSTRFRIALTSATAPPLPSGGSPAFSAPPSTAGSPPPAPAVVSGTEERFAPGPASGDSPPAAPMQVVLTVIRGPSGEVVDGYASRLVTWLGAGQTVRVGRRAASADLAVHRDPKMSSLHFRLSCDGRHCRLEDLQSRNGTYVNGSRVVEAVLQDHDEIRAGDTIFGVAICGGAPLSRTFLEFAAVAHRPAESAAGGGVDLGMSDVDAVFAMIKSKLKDRV